MRLFDVPGLVYPPEMLVEKPRGEEILKEAPPWAISSEQAAEILHCRSSSARILLNNAAVEKCKVKLPGAQVSLYWRQSQVEDVARARPQEISTVPEAYMGADDAAALLAVSRSTLRRYVRQGVLHPKSVRFRSPSKFICLKTLYLKSEIQNLHAHVCALRGGDA